MRHLHDASSTKAQGPSLTNDEMGKWAEPEVERTAAKRCLQVMTGTHHTHEVMAAGAAFSCIR